VIIASYPTKAQAQTHINRLKGIDTTNTGIVLQRGNYRVYAQSFTSQKEAESYKTKLQQNPNHKQAWISKGP